MNRNEVYTATSDTTFLFLLIYWRNSKAVMLGISIRCPLCRLPLGDQAVTNVFTRILETSAFLFELVDIRGRENRTIRTLTTV